MFIFLGRKGLVVHQNALRMQAPILNKRDRKQLPSAALFPFNTFQCRQEEEELPSENPTSLPLSTEQKHQCDFLPYLWEFNIITLEIFTKLLWVIDDSGVRIFVSDFVLDEKKKKKKNSDLTLNTDVIKGVHVIWVLVLILSLTTIIYLNFYQYIHFSNILIHQMLALQLHRAVLWLK